MGSTLRGVDGVSEGVDGLCVGHIPLQCEFDTHALVFCFSADIDHRGVRYTFTRIDVTNKVGDAAFVVVTDGAHALVFIDDAFCVFANRRSSHSLIGELDGQALVQERHLLEAP